MFWFLRMGMAVAVLSGVAVAVGWTTPYLIRLGMPAAGVVGGILALIVWTKRPRGAEADDGLNLLRETVIGIALGGAWVGAMVLYFAVAAAYSDVILDWDRLQTEELIARLESKRQWSTIIDMLEEELAEVHSPGWTKSLAEQLVLTLGRAAHADPEQAERLLERAGEVARAHELPTDLIDALRHGSHERRRSQDAVRAAQERQAAEVAAIKDAANDDVAQARAATSELREQLAREQQRFATGQQRLNQTSAEARLRLLSELLRQARESNVAQVIRAATQELDALATLNADAAEATSQLRDLEAWFRQGLPRPFPADAIVQLRAVHPTGVAQLLLVDLAVQTASLNFVDELRATDIVATQRGRRLHAVALAPTRSDAALAIAILVDTSASTQGGANAAAKQATKMLIADLPPGSPLWLASFNDRTTVLADWSADLSQALAGCDRLQAGGHTALFAAIDAALDALARRPEARKVLVVYTDGANTLPGPSPEELVALARRERIQIMSIALQGGQVDERILKQLADETGGASRVVSEARQLSEEFRRVSAELSTPLVRLAAMDYDPEIPCELAFGAGPEFRLTLPPSRRVDVTATRNMR